MRYEDNKFLISRKFKQIKSKPKIIFGLVVLFILSLSAVVYFEGWNSQTAVGILKDMIPQLLGFLIAIFFIEFWIEKQRLGELKNLNLAHSNNIEISINRLVLHILNYVSLADINDQDKLKSYLGEDMNFRPAIELLMQVTPVGLKNAYIEGITKAKDRKKYVDDFIEILQNYGGMIKDEVSKLYPVADPRVKSFFETDFHVYQGAINSTSQILGYSDTDEFKKWKSETSSEEVMKFEKGFSLLMTKFNPGNKDIEELAKDLIEISNLARENRLFVNIKL